MIPAKGKVIVTEALPPRDGQPAAVNWQYAEELPVPEIMVKAGKKVRLRPLAAGALPFALPVASGGAGLSSELYLLRRS